MPIGNSTLLALHMVHEQERIKRDYRRWSAPITSPALLWRGLVLVLLLVLLMNL